jgi:hypothetical protein
MNHLTSVTAASLIAGLLGAPLPEIPGDQEESESRIGKSMKKGAARARTVAELPEDTALPLIREIQAASLGGQFPSVDGRPVEFVVRSYKPRKRVTIEVRAGRCRFAVKAYASDPAPEAELYDALAAAGLAGGAAVRVPRLLAYDPGLRMEVIGWLEGPSAQDLIGSGRGEQAGKLAASWILRAAVLTVNLGPALDVALTRREAVRWTAKLDSADPGLGTAARAVADTLTRTSPKEGVPRLVHGSLYARHVLDLSGATGLIDWDCFGQGALEADAGMFLATVSRIGLLNDSLAGEATRAEKAFLAATGDLLDERSLAWHRAAALLHLAERGSKQTDRRQSDWLSRSQVLLAEAARMAAAAG